MRWLAHAWLRMLGWTYEGTVPPDESFVAIGAPHTSNWDFVVFLAVLWEFRVRAGFLGKDTLFRWPLGILMRRLGGIPVNRARPHGVIDEAVAAFGKTRPMILVIAPESTRGRRGRGSDPAGIRRPLRAKGRVRQADPGHRRCCRRHEQHPVLLPVEIRDGTGEHGTDPPALRGRLGVAGDPATIDAHRSLSHRATTFMTSSSTSSLVRPARFGTRSE